MTAGAAKAASELDVSSRRVADLGSDARGQAERTLSVVRGSGTTVTRSIANFATLREAIVDSSEVMKTMGVRAEEIDDIVATINLIADRTNLLSLNASIEAARAGEHGRGFAVVAEEIRALSDRAAASSAEIAKIVRGLQSTARDAVATTQQSANLAEEGSAAANEAEHALGQILSGVEGLGETVKSVSEAVAGQVANAGTVSTSVARVAEQIKTVSVAATEQTTATQALATAAAAEMKTMAKQTSLAMADQARAMREIDQSEHHRLGRRRSRS